MLIFKKLDAVKYIAPESKLIPFLLGDGWECNKIQIKLDEDELREQAKELGIKVHHKAKAETIKAKIEEALNDNSE